MMREAYAVEARSVDIVPGFRDMALECYRDYCRCGPHDDQQTDDKTEFPIEGQGCEVSEKSNKR